MDPLVEFRADNVDGPALEAHVVARVVDRVGPGVLNASPLEAVDLASLLATLQTYVDQVHVNIDVRDQRLPVGNAMWNRIKYQFHELVAIYTNDLAGRQFAVNQHLVMTLELLIQQLNNRLAERDARIAHLEKELDALRKRVGE